MMDFLFPFRLMDYDTYSAHDAIGKVYICLNPLVDSSSATTMMEGWFPIFDTLHGVCVCVCACCMCVCVHACVCVSFVCLCICIYMYMYVITILSSSLSPSLPLSLSPSPSLPLSLSPSLPLSLPLSPSLSLSLPPSLPPPPPGVRGEVRVKVKLEMIIDHHRFKQSSCGVRFFACEFPLFSEPHCNRSLSIMGRGYSLELVPSLSAPQIFIA